MCTFIVLCIIVSSVGCGMSLYSWCFSWCRFENCCQALYAKWYWADANNKNIQYLTYKNNNIYGLFHWQFPANQYIIIIIISSSSSSTIPLIIVPCLTHHTLLNLISLYQVKWGNCGADGHTDANILLKA